MKNFKKLFSLMLAVLMVLTAIPVSANARTVSVGSAIYSSVDDVVIAVPETIYMSPVNGASTSGQYYVNNTVNNSGNVSLSAEAAKTTGIISIYAPKATAFSYKVAAASGNIGDPVISSSKVAEGTRVAFTTLSGSEGYVSHDGLALSISGTGLNIGASALLEWEVTVYFGDADVTGKTYYAYSVAYAPHRTIGAVSESRRSGTYNNEISSWITGGNANPPGGWSPLTTGSGSKTTQGYFKNDPLHSALPSGGSSNSSDDFVTSDSSNLYVEAKGTNGSEWTRAVSYLGKLVVDTSRYTNLNQIPNLKIGADALRVQDSKKDSMRFFRAWYVVNDKTTAGSADDGELSTPSGWTQFLNLTEPAKTSRNTVVPSYTITEDIDGMYIHTIAQASCYLFAFGINEKNYSNAYSSVQCTAVDKSELRTLVLKATSLNKNNYTAKSWNTFFAALKTAAQALCTPGVSDISSAQTALEKAMDALEMPVLFDNLIDFSEWNTASASNAAISNVTDGGFTLTSNAGAGEGTSASPFFPVTPGKQYTIDIDVEGAGWDVYIFFCDANGTWVDFADGPSNRYSDTTTWGSTFTAPNKSNVVKAQIRVDANGSSNAVKFSNIRVYEAGKVADGVSYHAPQTVTLASSEYSNLPEPTKEGYTFKGWVDSDGKSVSDGTGYRYEVGRTLYSTWTPNKYKVQFNGNGADKGVMKEQTFTYDVAADLTANAFTKTGYTFLGWATSEKNANSQPPVIKYTKEEEPINVKNLSAKDDDVITLYAVWSIHSYTIKFDANGGTGTYNPVVLKYGHEPYELPGEIFTRTGYIFNGWAKSSDATRADYGLAIEDSLTSEDGKIFTIYAVWKPISYNIEYNGNGAQGSMEPQRRVTYNTTANLRNNTFTLEDGTFLGWATSKERADAGIVDCVDGAAAKELTTTDGSTVTLYAVWKMDTYTVNFVGGEGATGTITNKVVTRNEEFSLPSKDDFKKDGHSLVGWTTVEGSDKIEFEAGDPVSKLTTGESITLYAVWDVAVYTIGFKNAAGTVVKEYYITHGQTFEGVTDIPNTDIAHDAKYHYSYSWPEKSKTSFTVTADETFEEIVTATKTDFVVDTEDATCTKTGSITRVCDFCGETTVEILKALGHAYDAVVTSPTCTEQGYTTYTCTVCDDEDGYTYVGDYVDALGHTPGEIVVENNVNPTCTKVGSYDDVTYCTVCGKEASRKTVIVPATGHDYDAVVTPPTCAEQGYTTYTCSKEDCDEGTKYTYVDNYVDATGLHTDDEGTVVEATCTTPAGTRYECTVCHRYRYEETGDPFGHEWTVSYNWAEDGSTCTATRKCIRGCEETAEAVVTSEETLAPTCTEKGKTTYTATFEAEWAETQTTTLTDIEELGHDWAQTTYDWYVYDGVKCTAKHICKRTGCGEIVKAEAVITPAVTTQPTCNTMGITTYTATFAEDVKDWTETKTYEIKNVAALGHTEAPAVKENEVAPTCTTYGSYELVIYCSKCTDAEGEKVELSRVPVSVSKLGHTWGGEVTYTWTEDGKACSASRECSVCKAVTKINAVVSAEVTTPATCEDKGTTTYTATFAKNFTWAETQVETRKDVPALGHVAGKAVIENVVEAGESVRGSYDKVVYCLRCNHVISRETIITACATNAHVAGEAVIENEVAATCGAPGTKDIVYYCTAEGCNAEISRETVETDPALEHNVVNDAAVAPTCTTTGLTAGSHCSRCGEVITAQEVIPAVDHDYDKEVTAPTCKTDGYTTYSCQNVGCDHSYEADIIPATGHTFRNYKENENSATCTKNATRSAKCENCDAVATITMNGTALGHDFTVKVENSETEATCQSPATVTYKCSRCDATTVVEVEGTGGHDWADATCTAPKTCKIEGCGATEGEALGHDWTEATCTAPKTCSRCDVTEGEALGHTWTEATCTAPKTCSVCDATEGEALGHDWVDATCTAPKTCKTCGETEGEEAEHSFNNFVPGKEATCTDDATEIAKCDNCNATRERTVKNTALGHDFKDRYVSDNNATCIDYGTLTATCSRCDATDTIPGTEYAACDIAEEGVKVYTLEPTCDKTGTYYVAYFCTVCEKEDVTKREEEKTADALGHDFTKFLYSTEGTCVTPFSKTYGCSRCDDDKATLRVDGTTYGNHSPRASVKENEVLPTCVAAGSYDKVVYCSYKECDCSYKGEPNGKAIERTHVTVPATGNHTPAAAVKENEVASTCSAPGSYDLVVYCSVCKTKELSREEVKLSQAGHKAGAEKTENEVAATCGKAGSYDKVVYCTVCKEEMSRTTVIVPKLGNHKSTEVVIKNETPATTEKGGSYEEHVICNDCGKTLSKVKVDTPKLPSGSDSGSNSGSDNTGSDDSGSSSGSSSTGKLSFWDKLIAFFRSLFSIFKK